MTDALAKATGQAHYVADVVLRGMMHAAVARSTVPLARIVRAASCVSRDRQRTERAVLYSTAPALSSTYGQRRVLGPEASAGPGQTELYVENP